MELSGWTLNMAARAGGIGAFKSGLFCVSYRNASGCAEGTDALSPQRSTWFVNALATVV